MLTKRIYCEMVLYKYYFFSATLDRLIAIPQNWLQKAKDRKWEAENTQTIAMKQQCLLSFMKDVTNIDELTKVIQDETKTIQDDIKNYNIKSKHFSLLQSLKLITINNTMKNWWEWFPQ